MNIKHQWLFLFSLFIFLSVNANAEVYKWTDKDGVVRYTDIPPPSNVKKYTTIGNKKVKEVVAEPVAAESKVEVKEGVANDASKPKLNESQQARKDMKNDSLEAKKRQQADIDKQNKEKKRLMLSRSK